MGKDSLVNTRLDGYFIESLLGRGGMARVYRGVDLARNRYAALKVINAANRDNPESVGRFEREAQVVASLGGHPNVVQLYEYGEDNGYLYIAMQYIEGVDLAELLRNYRQDGLRMPYEDILAITRDVTGALDYIHSRDVVHRDMKPSNIMIDRSGRAILTDFGLALLVDVGTLGEVFGSPAYIAPEQAVSSAGAVPASDLYSLGVILFEMFTGQQPFTGQDPLSLAMQHVHNPPPLPSSMRRGLSPEIDRVLMRALAKRPEDRYPSGQALLADLERAVQLSPQPLAPPPTLAHITIPDRVRQLSRPLPPPTTPPESPPAPPPTTIYPAPGMERSGPYVIPAPERGRSPWTTALTVVAGMTLLVALLCVGSGLAARGLFSRVQGVFAGSTPLFSGLETTIAAVVETQSAPATPLPPTGPSPTLPVDTPLPTDPPPPPTPETVEVQPTEEASPTPTPPGPTLPLILARLQHNHLVIANDGDEPLPLGPLRIGRRQDGIEGSRLGPVALQPDECIVILNPDKKDKMPQDIGCNIVMAIERRPETLFWVDAFTVFFSNEPVGDCGRNQEFCTIQIPIE